MKILLVQTSFLGDIILATPLIAAIKRKYPQAELSMLTTRLGCELLERDPAIDKLYAFEKRGRLMGLLDLIACAKQLKQERFDLAYSLHRSARTALLLRLSGIAHRVGFADANLKLLYTELRERSASDHAVMRNLSLLSASNSAQAELELAELALYAPDLNDCSEQFRQRLTFKDYIVLVPGSVWSTKQWDVEAYRELALHLKSQGHTLVLSGSKAEVELCERVGAGGIAINFAGQSSLAEAMYLIKNARSIVCNDSMSLHMASAFKTPCISIFCATSPKFGFGPWKNRACVVERQDLSCKPCARHGGNYCPKGTWACTSAVLQSEVISSIEDLSRDLMRRGMAC